MRKSLSLQIIRDEIANFRFAAKRQFDGAELDRVNSKIDDVGERFLALGREPRVAFDVSTTEGILATDVYGLRLMASRTDGTPPPPSPTVHLEARLERERSARDAAARRAVRDELRQADLAQRRAERKVARDALPKTASEKPTVAKSARSEPAGIIHDPRQMNLF